jgi:citrate synthase
MQQEADMNMQLSKTPIGLDGIAAAETVLSHVDGERGELIIAGERVGDLVPCHSDYDSLDLTG